MANNLDDEFGGFEEAPSIDNVSILEIPKTKEQIPQWLLPQQQQQQPQTQSPSHLSIKHLHDELNQTKLDLVELKTNYINLQTRHSIEIDQIHKEYKQIIEHQKDTFLKLFEHYSQEHSLKIDNRLKEIQAKQEREFNERLEDKIVSMQEKLIALNQSDSEDIEVKIRRIIASNLKEDKLVEQVKFKQQLDQIEANLKVDLEKYVQSYFKNESEFFKEQIKSGVQQEHLIHKDLINKKLESLFKSSEEKRRNANVLFSRHLSGLTFFIENAHKQLSILNQAQSDFLKNKDIIDYYGPQSELNLNSTLSSNANSTNTTNTTLNSSNLNNDLLFLFGSTSKKNLNNNLLKNEGENQSLVDEDLLNDLA